MSLELSRQLGLYYPSAASNLNDLRELVMRDRIERGDIDSAEFDAASETIERQSSEFQHRAQTILSRHGVARRPILLVLDTFEEWERGQFVDWDADNPMRRFLGWLSNIQTAWALVIKLVVSGRTPVPTGSWFADAGVIRLRDLSRAESADLLKKAGLGRLAASGLARITCGNPLALKLAARYYRRLPPERRKAFLRDTGSEIEGLDATFRQGVLYQRFLDHIPDPQARRLAHPGLALRRVTAELVRDVLAGPCGLGSLDEYESELLLRRLAREVWLVESRWPVVFHRPELRNVMLRAMRSDPARSMQIEAVHRAALRWYDARPHPSNEELAEALYHRLALDVRGQVDIERVPLRLAQSVAQSADDFDDHVRVRLLYRLGRPISPTDAALLPEALRQRWADRRGDELVRSGRPDQALGLWRALGGSAPAGNWYAAAAFQSQHWRGVPAVPNPAELSAKDSLRYHYLISFVLEEDDPGAAARLRHSLRRSLDSWLTSFDYQPQVAAAYEALYFATLVDRPSALEHRRKMSSLAPAKNLGYTSHQYLRARALFGYSLELPTRKTIKKLLTVFFRPRYDFINAIEHRFTQRGVGAIHLADFRKYYEDFSFENHTTAEILGELADRFAVAVINDLESARWSDASISLVLDHLSSDDLEWHVPIRTALVHATQNREWVMIGQIDARERRAVLLGHVGQQWTRRPPQDFVCAAGIMDTSPAMTRLLRVISRLSLGIVILQGLSRQMTHSEWARLGSVNFNA